MAGLAAKFQQLMRENVRKKFLGAVNRGQHVRVAELLRKGVDPDTGNHLQWSALHIAVMSDDVKIVRVLLAHGANPNARNNLGRTPLHHAVICANVGMIRLLLDNGADRHAQDNEGHAPLYYAYYAPMSLQNQMAIALACGGRLQAGRLARIRQQVRLGSKSFSNLMVSPAGDGVPEQATWRLSM